MNNILNSNFVKSNQLKTIDGQYRLNRCNPSNQLRIKSFSSSQREVQRSYSLGNKNKKSTITGAKQYTEKSIKKVLTITQQLHQQFIQQKQNELLSFVMISFIVLTLLVIIFEKEIEKQ